MFYIDVEIVENFLRAVHRLKMFKQFVVFHRMLKLDKLLFSLFVLTDVEVTLNKDKIICASSRWASEIKYKLNICSSSRFIGKNISNYYSFLLRKCVLR